VREIMNEGLIQKHSVQSDTQKVQQILENKEEKLKTKILQELKKLKEKYKS